jgi:hypothetical protein
VNTIDIAVILISPLTTHHSPLTTHHSPLTTHHSPLTTHHSPLTTHHSPLTTHHSPLTTHHSLQTLFRGACAYDGSKIVYATNKLGLGDLSQAARAAHWFVSDAGLIQP